MLLLGPFAASLAGTLIVLGAAMLILSSVSPKTAPVRVAMLLVTTLLSWRYMYWRITETVPDGTGIDAIAGWTFVAIEAVALVSSNLAYFILTRHKDRCDEATANLRWWGEAAPRVDVYIATYNEEESVLERTLAGAAALDYPNFRVFVLDDGRRPWLEELCARYGAEHRTRPDNAHAKAGNINHTLRQRLGDPDAPDFIAVLDADFVPHRDFVARAVALFHDPGVGLVQTPQHFFNPDPIQHNLNIARAYPDEQRFFFDHLEPSRDGWGIAFCCGTSSVVRAEAVKAIGGLPTESVTEDFLLTIRLSTRGYRTVYLNEALTEGLAPEGLHEYVVQRGRWCLGMMEIIRNVYNPFAANDLPPMQRLSLVDSAFFWTTTFHFRLVALVCPLLYWYFGIIVVDAPLTEVLTYYVPYYAAVLVTLNWISGGMIVPVLNDVSQLLAAWPVSRAVWMGLFTKGPHKFRVTAKGGDRTRTVVQWPIMKPFAILFGLTVLGLALPVLFPDAFPHTARAGDGIWIIMFWTLYNLVVLGVAMLTCIERPRINRPQRDVVEAAAILVGGERIAAWLLDLGPDQARLRGPGGLVPGQALTVEIDEVGPVAAEVTGRAKDGYQLRLMPDPAEHRLLLRKLHTRAGTPGAGRADFGLAVREWARDMVSR